MPTRPRNPLNRPLHAGIRAVGFRKWYERELLSSHAHLILTLLSTIGLLASFEAFSGASTLDRLADAAFIVVCAGIAIWSLRRYLFLLMHAEHIANQACCPECGAYGRLIVVRDTPARNETQVECKGCQAQWPIDN